MYHMLAAFNLAPGVYPREFRDRYQAFVDEMAALGLTEGTGPMAQRHTDSPLDTAADWPQSYIAIMRFTDAAQADRAYDWIKQRQKPGTPSHNKVFALTVDAVFLAYDDI